MGLAYEIVINSDPCIAYLMEENTMTMQALVIAHAATATTPSSRATTCSAPGPCGRRIIDYLVFARNYIRQVRGAPRRGGSGAAARLLPRADELRRGPLQAPGPCRREERCASASAKPCRRRSTTCGAPCRKSDKQHTQERNAFPAEPQENLLYFIEKNAPLLEPWQREIVRIVRKIAQYFYPQRQTQVMNEGWATFWHYTLLNRLYDKGLVTDGFMLEFLQSHTNVVFQPPFNSPITAASIPTRWASPCSRTSAHLRTPHRRRPRNGFPTSPGGDWLKTLDFAMRNFKDESFIAQYLSPKLMRD
jgi:stage V sporulation protein R